MIEVLVESNWPNNECVPTPPTYDEVLYIFYEGEKGGKRKAQVNYQKK